ncbi:uncharacterized protein LOC105737277 isoform X1 [Apis florea]|uniref:uncharacterized protein LOC105737277 isoform X1 n=1 Tax=Apis florea TaxID=7463 RepID=UPI0012FED2E8|nr:uncharacterized protein LOC105737277 isoform X1 [Apis florea]
MRLMQRLAISGLLSVILIVLLTGTFVTRRDLANVVERGAAPEERGNEQQQQQQQANPPAWVQSNVIPGQDEAKPPLEDKDRWADSRQRQSEPSAVGPPPLPVPGPYVIKPPNPPLDDVTNQRREKIKEMMKHGWDNYVRYAWGKNELRPISKRGHSASIFGASNMGATIVDGLDTLYIMGLHDEFKQGRDWIAENLDFDIIIVLLKSEITLRNYILTLSETFPLLLFFLRYIYYITIIPYVEFLFNHIRTEEHSLQDTTEIQIQTKYLDISSHIIYFFGCVTFAFIAASIIFLVNPIILDSIMPLNESRVHFNVSFLFDDQSLYIKIFLILNCMLNVSLGLLCIMGTELLTNIFSYYICRQFHIASYRIRKIIEDLSMPLSKQIELKLIDIHRVVDIHNDAIKHINLATSNAATQYLLAIVVCILSFSVNLYRVSNF